MAENNPVNPFDNLRTTKEDRDQSIQWFQSQIKILARSSYQAGRLLNVQKNLIANPTPGKMYLYRYDAKTKDTIKYWDSVPIIFFLKRHDKKPKELFYAINLHYLPPDMRLALLKKLYSVMNNQSFSANSRLKITWDILIHISKANNLGVQNAIKMYRFDHMESKFLEIYPNFWSKTMLLPIEKFHKASSQVVWFDTRRNR